VGIIVSILAALAGFGLKLWGMFRKSAADKVAKTDHAMLEDAVNRTDPNDVSRDMRDGNF
jgi:hypothetical protein